MEQVIYRIDELRQSDNQLVGKKCANLGELARAGFRVPTGFAASVDAYARFMEETGLRARIEEHLKPFVADPDKPADLPRYEQVSLEVRRIVEETPMPSDIEALVRQRYAEMCAATGTEDLPVATRSAGPESHPGQYETYLHVCGADEVVRNVVKVWSSTFNSRSMIARARAGLSLAYDPIGVAILAMVDARAAGVLFTANPGDGDESKLYIESNWGLGESVVAGEVTPDSFLVDRQTLTILKRTISRKEKWFAVDPVTGRPGFREMPADKRSAATLTDGEIVGLATVGQAIEDHFGAPQDIEWAVDSRAGGAEGIFLLQTRPIKTKIVKKSTTDRIIDLMMRGISDPADQSGKTREGGAATSPPRT